MKDTLTICRTTLSRLLQIKTLYVLLLLAMVFNSATALYGDLTAGREKYLMIDTGYALMSVIGFLSALVVIFDLARDLRHKLVQTLLTKPLGRDHYLLGKFWGIMVFTLINVSLFSIGFGVVLWFSKIWVGWGIMKVLVLTLSSTAMLIAIGILLSVFSTSIGEVPPAIGMLLLFWLGNASQDIASTGAFGSFIFGIIPNFDLLNIKMELGNYFSVSWAYVWGGALYAALYTTFLMGIAVLIFRKQDI